MHGVMGWIKVSAAGFQLEAHNWYFFFTDLLDIGPRLCMARAKDSFCLLSFIKSLLVLLAHIQNKTMERPGSTL